MAIRVGRSRRWLAAGMTAVALLGLAGCGDDKGSKLGKGENADIVIDNQGFKPNEAQVQVGQEVVFTVFNKDSRPHTFTLPFLEIDKEIPPGQQVDVKLKATEVPPAGFYSFYSNNHQSEGYQGRINVES
ncbi:MAG: cupredoxin domain-containing protein [Acidimicrobiales bacterium]